MRNLLLITVFSMLLFACTNEKPAEKKVQEAAATSPPQYEFADPKYVEIGKQAFEALSKGNVDQWLGFFADNAVYQWNNFDSLAGKAAIDEFWRKRRTEVVNNLVFSGHIFLPMKVNKPQAGEQAGNWLLTWCVVDVTYHNGNKMVQFMHIDYHFDANDKIDRVLQFLDNEPINKALAAN